ncbi:hypothetical protein ED733_007721 [Metarhizium rileyi]|uniref:Uncharacterized protein n=1 Tax=Metarhizium rileyi (strain RCEF 4871) TaxID=1649241 RepID=A0A5C6GLU5_METRR|nr:hypothetical protein ED733_007721 [Metarhizium rileyi]
MEPGSSFSSESLSPAAGDTRQQPSTLRKRKNEEEHRTSKTPRIEALNAQSVDVDSHWQSIAFFHEVIADAPHASSKYASLNPEQKLILALGARNLSLATCRSGSAGEKDKKILERVVGILDADEDPTLVGGMSVSFYPSRRYSMLKYIADLDGKVRDGRNVNHFAQVMKVPRLFAVFVNPAELSYHNFENIVPLDRWVEERMSMAQDDATDGLELELADIRRLDRKKDVFTAKLDGTRSGMLRDISDLSLYVAPLNRGTRGGERFIFHSAILSQALTRAVKTSRLLDLIGHGKLGHEFEFVNYVFRSNKFAAADGDFENHLDSPYYDRARNHVSKYTLLIYLSAGQNTPLLRVQGVDVGQVEEMTCVIFDQKYEHEGRPFIKGDKVFLRTELVFRDENLRRDDAISKVFSSACYMAGQSLFDRELASYAHECFERANSLHWSLDRASRDAVYLLKQFQGLGFMTNGYNYWFPKCGTMSLQDYAAMSVLDYFNCKIGSQPFRSLAESTVVKEQFGSAGDIWRYLCSRRSDNKTASFPRLQTSHLDSLIKRTPDKPFEDGHHGSGLKGEELENPCCFMHTHPSFNPWRSKDVMDMYDKCSNYTRGRLLCAPIVMLDNQVVLNDDNIQVAGDKVHILQDINREALPPLNFAACWAEAPMPEAFVTLDREVPAPQLLVPPIRFHEFEDGFELGVDFFRNDWLVRVDTARGVPVPRVVPHPVDEGENPFFERLVSRQAEGEGDLAELDD